MRQVSLNRLIEFLHFMSRKLALVPVKKIPIACVNLKDCVAERGMQLSTWFVFLVTRGVQICPAYSENELNSDRCYYFPAL
jgi:hypothetical protein